MAQREKKLQHNRADIIIYTLRWGWLVAVIVGDLTIGSLDLGTACMATSIISIPSFVVHLLLVAIEARGGNGGRPLY